MGLFWHGAAARNAVVAVLSFLGRGNSIRQYLREWLYDGQDHARPCRAEVDVGACFAPLLRWVLAWWQSDKLALAIDPTLKGDQISALVISVVYRSCAIPLLGTFCRQPVWAVDRPGDGLAAGTRPRRCRRT